jgi:hypothetical protein
MRSTEPSTAPGTPASLAACQERRDELLGLVRALPFGPDLAAVLVESLDPRAYTHRLHEGIRSALGAGDPAEWGAVGKVRRTIEAFGPSHFGLRRNPGVETVREELAAEAERRKSTVSGPLPTTLCIEPLPSTSDVGQTRSST